MSKVFFFNSGEFGVPVEFRVFFYDVPRFDCFNFVFHIFHLSGFSIVQAGESARDFLIFLKLFFCAVGMRLAREQLV